ncbi:MAG: hypothetical protein V3T16_04940 [Gemmatimonadales bacterium]
MWYGVELALREYVAALIDELDRLAQQLDRAGRDTGRHGLAARLARVRDRLRRDGGSAPPARVDALHRLAVVAEDRGWLEAGEAILLRKLAFRVAFYLRRERTQSSDSEAPGPWLDHRRGGRSSKV